MLPIFFSFTCKMRVLKLTLQPCSGGETGRHVRLRGVCRKTCEFESRPEHNQKVLESIVFQGLFGHFTPFAELME